MGAATRFRNDQDFVNQYLKEIRPYPKLEREEERALLHRFKNTQDKPALDKLITSNLRFVVSVSVKYQNQGLSMPELINEGNLGLIEAIHRFKPSDYSVKFISYAVWWIRQKIDQALKKEDVVRRPPSIYGTQGHIKRPVSKREQELGRFLNVYEISELVDLSSSRIQDMRAGLRGESSFDEPFDPSDDRGLYAVTPDASSSNLDQGIMEQERKEFVRRYLGQLDERDRIILEYRFGLRGDRPLNLEEIGGIIGVTKERIRQLETRARGKLKKMVTKELIMTQIDLG